MTLKLIDKKNGTKVASPHNSARPLKRGIVDVKDGTPLDSTLSTYPKREQEINYSPIRRKNDT